MQSTNSKQHLQCRSCVMDTTDPEIFFNMGTCNHCIQARKMEWERMHEKWNLPKVINKIKEDGFKNDYDCLIGLSGGVDSSLALHYIVELGLRPLAFSIDNGWNTPQADENIMRLVETLKVPFYRYTIDTEKFKELQTAFIYSQTPNIEIPTDHILMASTYEMAEKYNIKHIISGGNVATESIMPKSWGYNARDLKFIMSIRRKFAPNLSLSGLPTMGFLKYLKMRFVMGVSILNLLDYYEYNRNEAIKLLEEKYGWKNYGEKHEENEFTKWFQNCYLPQKFGIDKRKAHLSSMINSKQITKEEALVKLQEPFEFKEVFKIEGPFVPKSHKDYPNHEWLWNLFTGIYKLIK